MMIYYSQNYLRKSEIPDYPMKGYWYQFGRSGVPNIGETWEDLYLESYSRIYPSNTMIKTYADGVERCSISIKVNELDRVNPNRCIYVLALDTLKYDTIESLIATNNPSEYFSQVAAIIIIDEVSNFSYYHNNIIDLKYIPKCSFELTQTSDAQVNHYQSSELDINSVYTAGPNQFLDIYSSNDKLREQMTDQSELSIRGRLNIRKSGVIQL